VCHGADLKGLWPADEVELLLGITVPAASLPNSIQFTFLFVTPS
jgi:hypothetical protein